ncbi:hypothetical protein QUF70_15365, partial [Desulfobacterales bacterium HSG17]|nr:hypothetical protein [Desulfobacterales bacterium HSG17]
MPLSLETEPFSHSQEEYTHAQTQWQITQDEEFSNLTLNIISSEHLTEFPVPEDALNYNLIYFWRAKFYDNQGNESQWSNPARFYTADKIDLPEEPQPADKELHLPQPPESENVGGA